MHNARPNPFNPSTTIGFALPAGGAPIQVDRYSVPALADWNSDGLADLIVDEKTGDLNPKLTEAPSSSEPELERTLHKTIKKVTEDLEGFRFNTAISAMMVFTNEALNWDVRPASVLRSGAPRRRAASPASAEPVSCR